MKDLKDLFTGMSISQKYNLKDFKNCEATDIRIYLDAAFHGVKRLFVTVFHDIYSGKNKVEKKKIYKLFSSKSEYN